MLLVLTKVDSQSGSVSANYVLQVQVYTCITYLLLLRGSLHSFHWVSVVFILPRGPLHSYRWEGHYINISKKAIAFNLTTKKVIAEKVIIFKIGGENDIILFKLTHVKYGERTIYLLWLHFLLTFLFQILPRTFEKIK